MKIIAKHKLANKTSKPLFDEVNIPLKACFGVELEFLQDSASLDPSNGDMTQEFEILNANQVEDIDACIEYLRKEYPLINFYFSD